MEIDIEEPDVAREEPKSLEYKDLKTPKANTVTAKSIDMQSMKDKFTRRENRKKQRKDVSEAEAALSEASMKNAYTHEKVIESQKAHLNAKNTLESFNGSNAAKNEKQTQYLRTMQAYQKIAAEERMFVKNASKATDETRRRYIPVMCIGRGLGPELEYMLEKVEGS